MITFFVSSTFNDMQAERDYIHQIVEPKLRREAAKYGESVRLLDLRWGVNTEGQSEEESSKKVLDVCLREIDECNGNMVVLLGNRYGWIPDYSMIPGLDSYGIKLEEPVSVTELEIQYGILQRNQGEQAVILFRDEVTGLHKDDEGIYRDGCENPRMPYLKERLSQLPHAYKAHYSLDYREEKHSFDGLEEFGELLFDGISRKLAMICRERADETKEAYVSRLFDALIEERSVNYLPVPELHDAFEIFQNSGNPVFLAEGSEGQGKTSFAADFCKNNRGKRCVIPYFTECGVSTNVEDILDYYISRTASLLNKEVNISLKTAEEKRILFSKLTEEFSEEVYFVLDSIDAVKEEAVLKLIPFHLQETKVRFVFTSEQFGAPARTLRDLGIVTRFVIPKVQDMGDFVYRVLASMGKELPKDMLRTLMAEKGGGSYLYGKLAVKLLSMIDREDFEIMNRTGGNIETINRYIGDKIDDMPPSLEAMGLFFIYESGKRLAPKLFERLMKLWAVCSEGLREQDYAALLPDCWEESSFQRLAYFMDGIYEKAEDGSYRFLYRPLTEASKVLYDAESNEALYRYLKELPDEDPMKLLRVLEPGLLHRDYDLVSRLVRSNQESETLIRHFQNELPKLWKYLPSLFREEEILGWFLERVSGGLHLESEKQLVSKALLQTKVPESPKFRMHMFETIAVYGMKPEYYRDALSAAYEAGELLDAARFHLQIAKEMVLHHAGELESLRFHLLEAKHLTNHEVGADQNIEAETLEHELGSCCKEDLLRFLIHTESEYWNLTIRMSERFGTGEFLDFHSCEYEWERPKYLEFLERTVFRKHMMIELDDVYYSGISEALGWIRTMMQLLDRSMEDGTRIRFFSLLQRLICSVAISEKKSEAGDVLKELIRKLQVRLLLMTEWETEDTLALTLSFLGEIFENEDEEQSIASLSEGCRIWLEMAPPGQAFSHAERLGDDLKKLFMKKAAKEAGDDALHREGNRELHRIVMQYHRIMRDYYQLNLEKAHDEAQQYPDDYHIDRLNEARAELYRLDREVICMEKLPALYCFFDLWRGLFDLLRERTPNDCLKAAYKNVDLIYERYRNEVKLRLYDPERCRIELAFLYECMYKYLFLMERFSDSSMTRQEESRILKRRIGVLEDWLMLGDTEKRTLGIKKALYEAYTKYAGFAELSEFEFLETESKKLHIEALLQKEEIPKEGIYTGVIFGTVTGV